MAGLSPVRADPGPRLVDSRQLDPERDRLLAAFTKGAAERGYRNLTVEQVARDAGTSCGCVEAHFDDVEQGLLAAQDAFFESLWLEVTAASETAADWPAKVRAGLRRGIGLLVEVSALARVFTVEATATSLVAADRQFAAIEQYARSLRRGREHFPHASLLPEATERALIGGIASLISACLLAEDPAALAALESDLAELLLAPYVGESQARLLARG